LQQFSIYLDFSDHALKPLKITPMKNPISFLCAVMFAGVLCTACDDKGQDDASNVIPVLEQQKTKSSGPNEQQETENSESGLPQEIETGDVSFVIFMMDRHSSLRDQYHGKVTVINTPEELEELKGFYAGEEFPEVDLSEQSLLLACGGVNYGIHEMNVTSLKQLSASEYELNVYFELNASCVCPVWAVGVVTDKIDSSSTIKLNVTRIP
jgi:hypothetical protein